MNKTGPFSVDYHSGGAYVSADRTNLCNGCMSDGEVDAQIRLMKEFLDRIAVEMKRRIKAEEKKDIF